MHQVGINIIREGKSVNLLLWSKYCGMTTSAKRSGFLTTNISPSSDHEQIEISHVSIILASFLRKIGTVLNELLSCSNSLFDRYCFWPPLFNGTCAGLFDMMLMLWDISSAERYGKRWNGRATSKAHN